MSKYNFTAASVEVEVRRIAAESPEHVYESPSGGIPCKYVHDVNGHREPGCLIGQGFAALGVSLDDLSMGDQYHGGQNAQWMMETLCGSLPEESRWLCAVQRHQDCGLPWGDAVERADQLLERWGS